MQLTDNFYTIKETAKLLKVHEGSVRRWITQGSLKAVKLNGKQIRITNDDLVTFLGK